MELLYADDLVLMADSEEQLVEKIRKWKVGMEEKGLRVNLGKTKVVRCRDGAGQVFVVNLVRLSHRSPSVH